MMKLITTLIRGAAAEAEEAAFDRNATRILAQQLRDAATALELGKKELACAMAHRSSEERAVSALNERIETLENGAIESLNGGRPELAEEAATVIAAVEDERKKRQAAIEKFNTDIARLQKVTVEGQRRLRELRRGLEMSRAQEALNKAGANGRRALDSGTGALREAEETLARIKNGQAHTEDTITALETLEAQVSGAALDARMAEAGFGPNVKTNPTDVLGRLKAKASNTPPSQSNEKS
ncbi:MAG: PspA/IM30 family protein [Filomicrobium sp.]